MEDIRLRHDRDRARFESRRSKDLDSCTVFSDALSSLFHPILPESQAELDRIFKDVTKPVIKETKPKLHRKWYQRRQPRS